MVSANAELRKQANKNSPVGLHPFGRERSLVEPGFDRDAVEQALWSSLPFSDRSSNSTADRDALIAAYRSSHAKLARTGVEIDRLFSSVARASIEIRDCVLASADKRRDEYRKKLAEIRQAFSFEHEPDEPLSADSLLLEPMELVEFRIERRLREEISRLVNALLEKLSGLKAENVLGQITWNEEGGCKFDYFGHVIIRNAPTLSARRERNISRQGFMEVATEDTLTVATQTITYRAVHHEHLLENAEAKCPANYSAALPVGIGEIIAAIPSWLRSVMTIVVGDCVHERIIEQDIGERIQEEIIWRESVRTERYIDPAIVMGRYALVGWGEREILTAEVSQARAGVTEDKKTETGILIVAADSHRNAGFAAVLAGLIIFIGCISSSVILPAVGIGLAIGGVLLLSYSFYLRSKAAMAAIGLREIITLGTQISSVVGTVFASAAAVRLGSAIPLGLLIISVIAFVSARRFANE